MTKLVVPNKRVTSKGIIRKDIFTYPKSNFHTYNDNVNNDIVNIFLDDSF